MNGRGQVDPRVIARARALGRQARSSNGPTRRRPAVNLARVAPRPPVLFASVYDPETGELGEYPRVDYELGALPLLSLAGGLAKPLSSVGSTLSLGLIKRDKNPGRLRSNAEAYNRAIAGDAGALAFLLQKSPKSKGGQGGWATAVAQNDAWAKYQSAKAALAGVRPATPVTIRPPAAPLPTLTAGAGVPQILQSGAQQILESAGIIPQSSAPAPYYPPTFTPDGQIMPGSVPTPAEDGAEGKANVGLLLGLAGIGIALASMSRSNRR